MNFFDSKNHQSGTTQTEDFVWPENSAEVALPSSFNIATVQFERMGPDLRIISADGEAILVPNYFSKVADVSIKLPNGVELPAAIVTKLAGPVAPQNVLAQQGDAAVSEPIGTVETASGRVQVVRADGSRLDLRVGDPVYQGDELVTDGDGTVGIVFADETTFALGENGRMILDEMVYDPGGQDGALGLTLLSGAMTFVSGAVAKVNPDAMQITTPIATVGIRGTAGVINIDPVKVTMDTILLPELAGNGGETDPNQAGGNVVVGELSITNSATGQTTTLNQPGQGSQSSASGNTEARLYSMDEIGQLAGKTVASLPGGDSLIPPAIMNAIGGGNTGEQGNQQGDVPDPGDVLVDVNTAEALGEITQGLQNAQANLQQSAALASEVLGRITGEADRAADQAIADLTGRLAADEALYKGYGNTLLSLSSTLFYDVTEKTNTAETDASTTATEIETWVSGQTETGTLSSISGSAAAISATATSVLEAYGAAASLGQSANALSHIIKSATTSLNTLDPASIPQFILELQTSVAEAVAAANEMKEIVAAAQAAAWAAARQALSVAQTALENGDDAATAATAARNAIVADVASDDNVTVSFMEEAMRDALGARGVSRTLFSTVSDRVTSINSAMTGNLQTLTTGNDLANLIAYAADATTQSALSASKAVETLQSRDADVMDTAADAARVAGETAATIVGDETSGLVSLVNTHSTNLISTLPGYMLDIFSKVSATALQSDSVADAGTNANKLVFNPEYKVANQPGRITHDDINNVIKFMNEAVTEHQTALGTLATEQSQFDSALALLDAASSNVLSALINYTGEKARADTLRGGADDILNGTEVSPGVDFNPADASGIDGLDEAKAYLANFGVSAEDAANFSMTEATGTVAQKLSDYNDAITALNNNPSDITLARNALLAEQELAAQQTLQGYARQLVQLWQNAYQQADALADASEAKLATYTTTLDDAKASEALVRDAADTALSELLAAQGDVSDAQNAIASWQSKLIILQARAGVEAQLHSEDALHDARALVQIALDQAEIAAAKATAAAALAETAKNSNDPSIYEGQMSTLLSEASTASANAKAAYEAFTSDIADTSLAFDIVLDNANENVNLSQNDGALSRLQAISTDYPVPPSDISSLISNAQTLMASALGASNEAAEQLASVTSSKNLLTAIVSGNAAEIAAAEAAATAAAQAAETEAINAAIDKAEAAQNEITSAFTQITTLKANALLISVQGADTTAANASSTYYSNVQDDYDAIFTRISLIEAEVNNAKAELNGGTSADAKTFAANAQTLANQAKVLVSEALADVQASAKAVISAVQTEIGTDNGAGTLSGLLNDAKGEATTASSELTTVQGKKSAVATLFTPDAGESQTSAILEANLDSAAMADEIQAYKDYSDGDAGTVPDASTKYMTLLGLKEDVNAASASNSATATAKTNVGSDAARADELLSIAKSVLNVASFSAQSDINTYGDLVKVISQVNGRIHNYRAAGPAR